MALPTSDLRQQAAAYVAQELGPVDRQAFEALLAESADLAREVAFWRACRPALARHGRPPARMPDLLPAVHARLTQPIRRRFDPWRWSGWAAAAACLALLIGQYQRIPAGQFDEQGAAVQVRHAQELPQQVRYDSDLAATASGAQRPWLGLWTRPVHLPTDFPLDRERGLLVTQVAGGSPAAAAGIQPGDILLELGDCPMFSRYCILHALEDRAPGSPVALRFWSAALGAERSADVQLGALQTR